MTRMRVRVRAALAALVPIVVAACASTAAAPPTSAPPTFTAAPPSTAPPPTAPPSTAPAVPAATSTRPATTSTMVTTTTGHPPTTRATTTSSTTSTSSTTTSSTSTTTTLPPTTLPPVATLPPGAPPARIDPGSLALAHLHGAVDGLVAGNLGFSVTLLRDGVQVFGATSGRANDGSAITHDTDFVLASVSKLVTAVSVARLAQRGWIDLDAPVPWTAMGLAHDPAWDDVTPRELLAHQAGMPVARKTWLDDPGPCTVPLLALLAAPPEATRGTWKYSNGNYCALGLLVEHVSGVTLDQAAFLLVFGPLGITRPHLTTTGARPDDAPYAKGLARLQRLGGAGTWMASTADVARMIAALSPADRDTLRWPGIMTDQYGWGHTGTLDGAKACTWTLDGGHLVLSAVVSGEHPVSGGKLCDVLVPALAADLGQYAGDPVRTPE